MANTTNLNLTKLAGTEKLKTFPSPYNDNMDAIDGAFGAGFGVSGKPTVNAEINSLADGLAIISNNNTHVAITAGQFVYVRGHGSLSDGLYVATSNISANGTLSGSNLTADASGGLNSVYASLNSKIDTDLDKVKIVRPVSNKFTLGNGFRGFLFASSAYANAAGLMEVYTNSSGEVTTRIYFGTFAEITFNTSVNGELSYSTSRYVEMRLVRFE